MEIYRGKIFNEEVFEKYTKTKKFIVEIAREKLGLVYEDEILIQSQD